MRQSLALVAPALFASGCSLIYNPNNIEKPPSDATDAPLIDAPMTADARIDAPALADANPGALVVEDAAPTVIYEGQGVDNSPPAILVIKGHHFTPGATVALSPNTGLTVGTPMISMNGDYIMVAVTAAVDASASTTVVPLTITVDEPGATPQMLANKVSLQPLPHLTGSTLTLPLAPRYSRVTITGAPAFAGTSGPVIIRSMSSITCAGINAKGAAPGSTTAAGAPGPGGCAGGGEGAAGGCLGVIGGGGAGGAGGGGGGGGYGTAGAVGGGGAQGGALGPAHGTPQIFSYQGTTADGADRNQASGGGGGAPASGLANGGGGGGGGGTVELTAGGDINCGTVDVSGGNGATATTTLGTAASGGGGGGAGGVIVVRTTAGTITNTTLNAAGGSPGSGAGGGAAGGQGGAGRIRIDAPGALPTTAPTGVSRRGLSFAAATPQVSTTDNPMVTLIGTAGDVFDMYVIDAAGLEHNGEPQNQTIEANGMKTVTVTLLPGYNKLCATLRPGTRNASDPFSLTDKCVEIALLP